MTTWMITACRLRRGALFRCGSDSRGVCQYCARSFCDRHGVVLEDGQEVCSRKVCTSKLQDVERHLVYKRHVGSRNRSRLCGDGDCDTQPISQCSRCKGLFCRTHAHRREDRVLENRVRVSRMATLCYHCWARRPLWLRR